VIPTPTLAWIFTVALAAAGAVYLCRGVRRGPDAEHVSGVLHFVLCGGMIMMAWPGTASFARLPQVLLFSLVAAWFAGSAVFDRPGHPGKGSVVFHVGMPVVMVWMVLVMPAAMRGGSTPPPAEGAHAGMSMGDTAMAASAPTLVVAALLTAAFAVAGAFWMVRAITTARRGGGSRSSAAGLFADAVMSIGMAVMTGLLI
jgi:hypothetical protein